VVLFEFLVGPFWIRSAAVQTSSDRGTTVPEWELWRAAPNASPVVAEEDGGVFDPEDIAVMATAFDRLLADFKLVERNDPVVTMLAKLVIELVRNGERDPEKIRRRVTGRVKHGS
jgi:hypothetical protein